MYLALNWLDPSIVKLPAKPSIQVVRRESKWSKLFMTVSLEERRPESNTKRLSMSLIR